MGREHLLLVPQPEPGEEPEQMVGIMGIRPLDNDPTSQKPQILKNKAGKFTYLEGTKGGFDSWYRVQWTLALKGDETAKTFVKQNNIYLYTPRRIK